MPSASDWLEKKALTTASHKMACLESGECKTRRDSQIRQQPPAHTHAKIECASHEIIRAEGQENVNKQNNFS